MYKYNYDQLNRIVSMQAYKGLNEASNTWAPISINDYSEATTYDPNGNILSYNRNGAPSANMPEKMDEMSYDYIPGKNQLLHVGDNPAYDGNYNAGNGTVDINNQTNANNYRYDSIGNLTSDASEGISNISWNVYGKIQSISKATGTITYQYDAAGNRISKTVGAKTTVYVRDASGNVMSVYESISSAVAKQTEVHLYGSSRLGMLTELTVPPVISDEVVGDFGTGLLSTFTRAEKIFELSNHLGNVLLTISDKKIAHVISPSNDVIDYFKADIITATDYYPFGMTMPARSFSAASGYRYGFNGKEKNGEIEESGNNYLFKFRIYDGRIGKFFSVDPLASSYPWNSTYAFAENDVIRSIDLEGLEKKLVFYGQKSKSDDNFIKNVATASARVMGVVPLPASTGSQFLMDIENNTDATNKLSSLTFFGHSWNQGLFLNNDQGFYKFGSTTGDPQASNSNAFGASISSGKIEVADHTLIIFASCGTAGDGTGGHGSGTGVLDASNSLAASMAINIGQNYVLEPGSTSKTIKVTVIGADDLSNLSNDKAKVPDGSFHKLEYQFKIERDPITGVINRSISDFKETNLGKSIKPSQIEKSHNDTDVNIVHPSP
jgi:RHS repeat-associated protein